ncbi:MAG: VCBS repeat-containing protein [Myxococcales bacterium]|nr:VCBS repeat-containing protein [Myxococcales bacterium]
MLSVSSAHRSRLTPLAVLAALVLIGTGCGSAGPTTNTNDDMAVPFDSSGAGRAQPVDDLYTVTPNEPFSVGASAGVLANDAQVSVLTAGAIVTAQGANVQLSADGSFTYGTPEALTGDDSFTYSVAGTDGTSVMATVTLRPRVGCGDGTRGVGELCFPVDALVVRGELSRSSVANVDADSEPELLVTSTSMLGLSHLQVFSLAAGRLVEVSSVELAELELSGEHALGDVNADGALDLLMATYSTLYVYQNDGTGQFTLLATVPFGASFFGDVALATGRFDADEHLDVVALQRVDSTVQLLRGDGTGSFSTTDAPVAVGPTYRVRALDVGNDGDLDVVLEPQSDNVGGLNILRGDGTGALVAETVVSGDMGPVVLETLFNGDAHPDLVLPGASVRVLPGDGAGDYGSAVDITPPTPFAGVVSAALGDFDGDTHTDVAAGANAGLRVALGTQAGALTDGWAESPGVRYEQLHTLTSATGADALIARNDRRVTRFVSDGARGMEERTPSFPSVRVGSSLTDGQLGDLDGDGALDLVVADYNTSRVSRLMGDGAGGFGAPTTLAQLSASVQSVALGRLDANGSLDVLTAETGGSRVGIWLADGAGGFTDGGTVAVGPGPARVVVGDFNGDTILDFVTANVGVLAGVFGPNQDTISIRLGTGSGTFTAPTVGEVPACANPERLAVGRVNNDAHLDLVMSCLGGDQVAVLLGDGAGGFTHASGSPIATGSAREVALSDLDGDDVLDFVVTQEFGAKLAVWLGAGDGTFSFGSEVPVGGSALSLVLGDFDGDGDVDVVTTTSRGAELFLGAGDGTFSAPSGSRLGAFGNEILAGDLTGDGELDLVLIDGPSVTTVRARY